MIINLTGQLDASGNLIMELPKIYFDQKFSYKIALTMIHVEMPHALKTTVKSGSLFCLNTNLVDRSSANPAQSIYHFWLRDKDMTHSTALYSRAVNVKYYGLHLFDFENATFEITRPFTTEKIEIKNIFIQLEVVKVDPYGRIQ